MTRATVSTLLLAALLVPVAPGGAQLPSRAVLVFEREIQGTEEHDVRWPVALASGRADELAVADAHEPRLLLFRRSGASWSLAASADLPAAPVGIAWDGARYLVSLRGDRGLMAVDGEALVLRSVGLPAGTVPGPMGPWLGGGVVLYDEAGHRVLALAAGGEVVSSAPVEGEVTAVTGAAGGAFYTAVGPTSEVRRHGADGSIQESWTVPSEGGVPAWPAGLAVTIGGETLVADRHGHRILLFRSDGQLAGFGSRSGWEPGLIRFPAGLAVVPDGRVAVADQGNGRIQIFRRVGEGSGR